MGLVSILDRLSDGARRIADVITADTGAGLFRVMSKHKEIVLKHLEDVVDNDDLVAVMQRLDMSYEDVGTMWDPLEGYEGDRSVTERIPEMVEELYRSELGGTDEEWLEIRSMLLQVA